MFIIIDSKKLLFIMFIILCLLCLFIILWHLLKKLTYLPNNLKKV